MSATNPLISEVGNEIVDGELLTDDHLLETESGAPTAPLSAHFRLVTLYGWLFSKFKVGLANGVATLDNAAALPMAQVPAELKEHWLHGSRVGAPADGEIVFLAVAGRPLALPIGLPGSVARCRTAPAADLFLALQVNGVAKGSFTIAAGTTVGVPAFAADLTLLPDDLVTLSVPTPTDAAARDFVFALKAIAA